MLPRRYFHTAFCVLQVVLGVLGCPNLPQQPIQEEDGAAGIAEKVGTEGIGCLFTAVKGQGAFVGPIHGKLTQMLTVSSVSFFVPRPSSFVRPLNAEVSPP